MSPQFVDFNGDGRLDIVAGTYDGSPHVALGSEKGYLKPEHILDEKGQRILINAFWNYETSKWDSTKRCDPQGKSPEDGHLTSAIAFDWNGDGAWDLLLGDYSNGYLYLRENRGTNQSPKFAVTNAVVTAGGKPLKLPGELTTMRSFDWDRDGRLDLVCGSFGDSFDQETDKVLNDAEASSKRGGVYLYRNAGEGKTPEFAAPVTLIAPGKAGLKAAARPDAGLYPDIVDWNGDGRWDLVVGGYSLWKPEARVLSKEEEARANFLTVKLQVSDVRSQQINAEIVAAAKGLEGDAAKERMTEARKKHSEEMTRLRKERKGLQDELDTLVPRARRDSFVWLYLNAAPGTPANGGSAAR